MAQISDFRQQKQAQGASSPLEKFLADARLRLVETGRRNRLVHTPRAAKRTRSLALSDIDADDVFATLVRNPKTIRFLARDGDDEAPLLALPDQVARNVSSGLMLQTILASEPLEKRLLSIYRDAKIAEEEQGINILYLAIGFLQWFEDERSDVKREAPLILVPVTLVRDRRRSTFDLKLREDDIATNQAIQERLKTDFGITLPEISEDESWRPSDYFTEVQMAIAAKTRWRIDENGAELGFYSFSKLLMIRDLEPDNWTEKVILEHPLLRGLLVEGFASEPPIIADGAKLDQLFAPADLIQVVDADYSQSVVIETVRAGRNLVVQGPPGTGKSQTITNIVAAAVHAGKTVLFVAEKMAALNVVHDRLRKAGLSDICLELHSRGANKRLVAEELDRTLKSHAIPPDAEAEAARIAEVRDYLNQVTERLHAPIGNSGLSPYRTLSLLIAASEKGITAEPDLVREAAGWSGADFAAISETTGRLAELTETAGPRDEHPYFGVRATLLQPFELERVASELPELVRTATELADYVEQFANYLSLPREPTLDLSHKLVTMLADLAALPAGAEDLADRVAATHPRRIADVAAIGLHWQTIRTPYLATFHDTAWEIAAHPLRLGLAAGASSFFSRFARPYRQSSSQLASLLNGPLPKKAGDRLALADALIAIQKAREELRLEESAIASMLDIHWRGEKTDFVALQTIATTITSLMAREPRLDAAALIEIARHNLGSDYIAYLTQLVDLLTPIVDRVLTTLEPDLEDAFGVTSRGRIKLRSLTKRATAWASHQDRFDEWMRLYTADSKLRALNAAASADGLATGRIPASKALDLLMSARSQAVWKQAVTATPQLREFYGPQHEERIGEFKSLEARRRLTNVEIVRGQHAAGIPRGNMGAMNTIRAEIGRRRGHMSIRKLIKTAGETIQKIKPVFLMSPISAAQFLPPGSVNFDLLVIDEASQVRPEDALGVVARAKQMVVVGDKKQLPPTSFFDRITADEEIDLDDGEESALDTALAGAAKATQLESILSLCEARGLDSPMLRWHYRSRHPSLIEVSNAEFYKQLIMAPAPSMDRAAEGLILRRVNGAYDRGGKRINMIEAEAVATAVINHARSSETLSLGIVTFSTAQRDAITDLLEIKRRTDLTLDEFLREGKAEDVFVKNLENVQGDERDVIFVSVGYGPRIAGARLDSMGFGPVSSEGGERRLNVLFTRARNRCEVFASFAAGDIDCDRAKGQGPRVLKRFLQYAETGVLEEHGPTSKDFDSPFEETVAAAIESLGYKVDKQVGSAGFKIDLAVRHPKETGRYILAVECDGATYHSALWARERDRLRQDVLENLGWRFLRIWSTDWFYRRDDQIGKLKNALNDALHSKPVKRRPEHVAQPSSLHTAVPPEPGSEFKLPPYKVATCSVPHASEPHEVPTSVLTQIVHSIVTQEGPIHQDEVARRVAALFGKERTGSRIVNATHRALRHHAHKTPLFNQGDFWMTKDQSDNPPVRDRSEAPLSLQRADMLPPIEIKAAVKIAVDQNGSLSDNDLPIAVARLLGFQRTGSDLKGAILKAR